MSLAVLLCERENAVLYRSHTCNILGVYTQHTGRVIQHKRKLFCQSPKSNTDLWVLFDWNENSFLQFDILRREEIQVGFIVFFRLIFLNPLDFWEQKENKSSV